MAYNLLLPISLPFILPTPLYGAMLAIWHLRPVLQKRFPLHLGRAEDFVRLLAWCLYDGRRHNAVLREIPEWDSDLSQPISLPEIKNDRWGKGYSVAMFLYGIAKSHYRISPMISDAKVRERAARAYWRGDRHKRLLPLPAEWQYRFIRENFSTTNNLVKRIRRSKLDKGKSIEQLINEFDLADVHYHIDVPYKHPKKIFHVITSEPQRVSFVYERKRPYLPLPLKAVRTVKWLKERVTSRPTEFQMASVTAHIATGENIPTTSPFPFGVNLFGYPKGELGIGEDVRLVALALKKNNIPFCIVNVRLSDSVSQQDRSVDEWVVSEPIYSINIFCITGIEQIRHVCEHGVGVLKNRYTIGLWPWELPKWPESCKYAYGLVNEIWGISEFTTNAYKDAGVPRYEMSLPVTVDTCSDEDRNYFGLPKNDYLFLFSFDFNSTLARKNPEGVVEAFRRAFPFNRNERVGLVLKVSHVKSDSKAWKQLKKIIIKDPRIYVVEETLRRPQVLALYKCCDCYVSLHRAEGFGRSLAEAMLLDMQLVATAYSGNLDFCSEGRVALVQYTERAINDGEYFFAQGQTWAAPIIEHAAELLRSVYEKPRDVSKSFYDFSPENIGARYARRLMEIKEFIEFNEVAQC